MANLKYQFLQAINNSFREGMDKHSLKKFEGNEDKIYSYGARDTIVDVSCQIAKFMKENYPSVRYIRDIKASHLNEFLKTKVNTCTDTTIQHHKSLITKLEHICNKKYNLQLDWSKNIKIEKSNKGKSIRDVAFSKEQVEKIKSVLESKRDSASKSALKVFMPYALRASEYTNIRVKDIDLNKMKLHIHKSKGGRNRDIDIRPESVESIKKLIEGKKSYDKLFNIKSKSLSTYLSRICKELGYKEITSSKTSIHALRKYAAREYYKEQLKNHSKMESLGNCMSFLGHGRNRKDLIKTYLGEI